jgi:hypothetical protein
MTKSTVSEGWKRAAGRAGACCCAILEGHLVLEAQQVPSHVVAVASPRRQREGTDDGVHAYGLKERSGFDLAYHLVLLRGGQRSEARSAANCRPRATIEIGGASDVHRTL